MNEQTLEPQDNSQPANEASSDLSQLAVEETQTAVLEETEQRVSELSEKNKQLFVRAKRAEEETKKLREELSASKKTIEPQSSIPSGGPTYDDVDVAVLTAKGHSEDEILAIKTFAKGLGKRMVDVLSDPIVKVTVDGLRSKANVEKATPSPAHGSASMKKSETEFVKLPASQQRVAWSEALERQRQKRAKIESFT